MGKQSCPTHSFAYCCTKLGKRTGCPRSNRRGENAPSRQQIRLFKRHNQWSKSTTIVPRRKMEVKTMFDSKHYVPILRWKAAEKEALEQLTSKEKESMTPLFEILMPQPKNQKAGE